MRCNFKIHFLCIIQSSKQLLFKEKRSVFKTSLDVFNVKFISSLAVAQT